VSPYLEAHQWVALVTYRYFHSFRDFIGDQEVNIPMFKNDTYVDIFDVSVAYAVTKRLSVSLEIPFQYGSRTNSFEHDLVHVHTTRAAGMGDIRLAGNFWLLNPDKHPNQNISLSLGVKMPTGDDAVSDYFYRDTGPILRPVDLAIQPGDGGWGIIFSGSAFQKVYKNTFAFLGGSYLSNPREFNGVQTPTGDIPAFTLGDKGEIFNSVPDQFLVRTGLTTAVWQEKGVAASLAVRWEGLPSHDLIGGSDGSRLAGYSVSIEPGVSISRGKESLAVSVPIAVYRRGLPAVPDVRIHSPSAGASSFADFQINITYSHLF
jgi:hypothetical protein